MDASEEFWNNLAARYAEKPVANLKAYYAKLDATKACLKPENVVLDVGCGTGSLALELSRCVSEVHAIDLSREMIKIANQKAADEDIGNVTFHHTTLANVSFESETFDAICAYSILHLFDDRRAALNKVLDHGLVSRRTDKADKRRIVLNLTKKGVNLYNEISPKAQAVEEHMLDKFSASERKTFLSLFATIEEKISKGVRLE